MRNSSTHESGPEARLHFRQENVNFVAGLNRLDFIRDDLIEQVECKLVLLHALSTNTGTDEVDLCLIGFYIKILKKIVFDIAPNAVQWHSPSHPSNRL